METVENKQAEIDRLLKKNPTGKLVEFSDGEWAVLKKPSRATLGLAMQKARTNPLGMVDVIAKNCVIGKSQNVTFDGDEGIGYLMGLAELVDDLVGTKKAEIKN